MEFHPAQVERITIIWRSQSQLTQKFSNLCVYVIQVIGEERPSLSIVLSQNFKQQCFALLGAWAPGEAMPIILVILLRKARQLPAHLSHQLVWQEVQQV